MFYITNNNSCITINIKIPGSFSFILVLKQFKFNWEGSIFVPIFLAKANIYKLFKPELFYKMCIWTWNIFVNMLTFLHLQLCSSKSFCWNSCTYCHRIKLFKRKQSIVRIKLRKLRRSISFESIEESRAKERK